jgi:hypothetical protein
MRKENKTLTTPEGHTLTFSDRASVEIKLDIPKDTLEVLKEIAKRKSLSVESVIKFFIGKGLRETEPELASELAVKRFKSRKNLTGEQEADLVA